MKYDSDTLWKEFFSRHALTSQQQEQFKEYYQLLVATNKLHNITAITDLKKVLTHHFDDSLALRSYIEATQPSGLADIGTGAGFPAIPLKLVIPELPLVLIEVNAKKRAFLQQLVERFRLTDVTISELDWRTFLRKTDYKLDLFCARASLSQEELIRVFKPSSPYNKGTLVYWASLNWQPSKKVAEYVVDTQEYEIGGVMRKLVFLKSAG